jgi:hypothetical protein
MVNINLKTGFVIIAIYEILYWLVVMLFEPYGRWLEDDIFNIFLWSIVVPVASIVIYLLIKWASKK